MRDVWKNTFQNNNHTNVSRHRHVTRMIYIWVYNIIRGIIKKQNI